jgi:hypothetical protein
MGGSNSTHISTEAAIAAAYKSCEAMKLLLTQSTLNAEAIAATFATVKAADRANVSIAICTEAWARGDNVLFAEYEPVAFKRSVDTRCMTAGSKGIQVDYLNKLYHQHLLAILRECTADEFADNLSKACDTTIVQDLVPMLISSLDTGVDSLEKLEALSVHLCDSDRAIMLAERARRTAAETTETVPEPVVAAAAEAVSVAIVDVVQAVDAVKVAAEAVGTLIDDLPQ